MDWLTRLADESSAEVPLLNPSKLFLDELSQEDFELELDTFFRRLVEVTKLSVKIFDMN
jgi:hypothetical protein